MALLTNKDGFSYSIGKYMRESLIIMQKDRSFTFDRRYHICPHSEDEFVAYINHKKVKDAEIILDDFSILDRCHVLEGLYLLPSFEAPNHISYEPVYRMPNLRKLEPCMVYGENDRRWTEFDCARLESAHKLEWFGADGKKNLLKNVYALDGLKSLLISHCRGENLKDYVGSPVLDTLELLRCGMKTLDGMETTRQLKVLNLVSCSKLESIEALESAAETLTGLVIHGCPNLKDYSVLSKLKKLKRLSLIGSGNIQSLRFLEQLPELKTLLLGKNVLDGDLSYCDRLWHVGLYPNRRHYNRKSDRLPKHPKDEHVYGDEEIESWRRGVISP